jgi:Ca-activated chloride channel family protein
MDMASSGASRNNNAWRSWNVIFSVLAPIVFATAAGVLRTPAQQAPARAAPNGQVGAAPQGESPDKPAMIHANVQLVNVPVTALNKRGMPVIDLNMEDFRVFEDGVEQTISHFDRETRMPLRVGLLLETSNSARSRLQYEKEAADEFVYVVLRNGNTKNQVFLQTFDASSSIIQDFTNDPDLLNEKIQNLKSGGGKALYDAIYFACHERMHNAGAPEETRRVLIILSDGLDVQSQHTLNQAISIARMTETMIYTIGTAAYGFSNPGDKLLEDLAAETGGYAAFPLREAPGTDMATGYLSHGQVGETSQNKGLGAETGKFSAERLVNLADALQAIGRNLDEQYELGYRPQRDVLDGTYRNIKVVMARHGVTLRWKPGYFATPQ